MHADSLVIYYQHTPDTPQAPIILTTCSGEVRCEFVGLLVLMIIFFIFFLGGGAHQSLIGSFPIAVFPNFNVGLQYSFFEQ